MNTKVTIAAALKKAAELLHKEGITGARQEANILMEYTLGLPKEKLLMELREPLDEKLLDKFFKLVSKRLEHYPLQYITGKQEFMGYTFTVNPNVLIPRRETEELVELVLNSSIKEGSTLIDVGTGSGAIAISIKKMRPDLKVLATDIKKEALEVAKENASRIGAKVEFIQGDLLKPLLGKVKADAIVSNPPYISEPEMEHLMPEVKFEPTEALLGGEDGLKYYREIALESTKVLVPGGKIFFEIGYTQAFAVSNILEKCGFSDIKTKKDYQGRDRFVFASLPTFR